MNDLGITLFWLAVQVTLAASCQTWPLRQLPAGGDR
jgi:hypothetical protein